MSRDELLAGILKLPINERSLLIHEAMDSIPEEFKVDLDMTPELRAKLDSRLRDMEEHPEDCFTLEEAMAELDRRQEERSGKRGR